MPLYRAAEVTLVSQVVVPAGGAASVDFTSIPATHRHLRLVMNARLASGSNDYLYYPMTFNADSAAHYTHSYLRGSGSAAASGGTANDTGVQMIAPDANALAAAPSQSDVTIFDYCGTAFFKVGHVLRGMLFTASVDDLNDKVDFRWQSAAAISRITLTPGLPFAEGSTFALYGLGLR